MFPIFARPRSTSTVWFLSVAVVLLLTTLTALSTTSVLAVAYQLSGKVTDQAGTAISGATVEVINPATSALVGSTTTTASGTYALSVESGTYNIRVTPPAGSQFVPSVSTNRSITANTVINVVLVASGSVVLSGQVKDKSGQGIPGQQVELRTSGASYNFSYSTDASGNYQFEVPPGNYHLRVTGSNPATAGRNAPAQYALSSQGTPLALTESMTMDIPLPVKRVALHVQDINGNPVAEARIETTSLLYNSNLVLGSLSATGYSSYGGNQAATNAAGDAVLWLFPTPTNSTYTFTVAGGNSLGTTSLSNIAVTEDRSVTITMLPSVVLRGQVKDAGGQGIAGQWVKLTVPGGPWVSFHSTDAAGNYKLQAAPGNYHLEVDGSNPTSAAQNAPGYYKLSSQGTPLALMESMTMDIPLPVKRVAVHVQDADGNPVANAKITTNDSYNYNLSLGGLSAQGYSSYPQSNGAVTNATGDAVLWLFPTPTNGTYTFTVIPSAGSSVGATSLSNIAVTEDRSVTITMLPSVVLRGQVKDAGGQGIAGQKVSLRPVAGGKELYSGTDASGNYRFEVGAGNYHLQVDGSNPASAARNAPGMYLLSSRTNTPLALMESMTMDIALPIKRVAVHVQDAGGNPVANAKIATNSAYNSNLFLNSLPAAGNSSYFELGGLQAVTNAAGDAVLWLFPTPTNGTYTFTVIPPEGTPFTIFDVPNITVTGDKSEIFVLQYVHAPPVTTATVTPTPNAAGVYPGPVTVSLAATATSGYTVAAAYYTIDNGPRQTYTGPFTVSGQGKHSVTYWSVDNAGVTEAAKLLSIEIASSAQLFLSPVTTTIGLNQFFQLDLTFDTGGQVADTVDGYLTFDPAVLEVVDAAGNPATSITPNTAVVGSVSYNRVDAATGQIDFSASQYDSPYLSGTATVATIRFRAKAPMDSTPVQLVRNGLRQSDLFLAGVRLNATLGHATVHIVDGALICGRVAVEQRGPAGTPRWITPLFRTEGATTTGGITLYQPGTTTEVARFAATTDANGRFCVTATGVPAGIYDVRVKGANTLSTQRATVDLRAATEISYGTLLVGDSSGDDGVTGADVSYIIPAFLSRSGEAGFRPYADTNRDDEITGADVSALIPNFLRGGPIAVTGAAQPEPEESRVQNGTPPQITLSPARQKIQVGEIVPVELKVELGATPADTVDLHVNIDPTLLEIVDASGQPVRSLTINRDAFADVTYNRVDAANGQISLSASRLTAPAATGSLTVATFYVRAKQRFTTTSLTSATTGTRRADVFARGQSLQPTLTGSTLSMGDLYRTYIPQARQ